MGKLGRPTPIEKAENVGSRCVLMFASSRHVKHSLLAGSVRRNKPTVQDVDIVLELHDDVPMSVLAAEFPEFHWTPSSGTGEIDDVRVEVFRAPTDCAGATLQFCTGPGELNVVLRAMAKRRGMKLSQYGLWRGKERIDTPSGDVWEDERQIFELLGVTYMEPEDRSNWKEMM